MAQITVQQTFDQALRHHQSGQLQQAEQLYRQVIAQVPGHADALHMLGVLAHQLGRIDTAVDLIRQTIALRPNFPEAYMSLGNALRDKGELDEAIKSFRQVIALKPSYPEAHNNLGVALSRRGQPDEAIVAFRQSVALNPGYLEAHSNLGLALRNKGQLDEAIAAYRQVIALKPSLPQGHNNLGVALSRKGQLDEAIAAFRQAIARKSDYAEAYSNLGLVLRKKGRLDEAIAACQQAIALKSNYAEAHNNLGVASKDQGRLDEAIAAFRRAVALRPNYPEAHSNLLYALLYHPAYDSKTIAEEHRLWNQQHAEPLQKFIQPHPNDRSPDRRLRIGYVSPYFREHCQSFFTVPLFAHHNHEQYEIFCYSDVSRSDGITERLRSYADAWRITVGQSDHQIAESVRQDRIDILVDLTMHMANSRLLAFARKPAPVQVTWLAYPGTTGVSAIDFRPTDPYLDPPGEHDAFYSERSIHLPDSFWCYDPLTNEPAVNSLPAESNGFITFGCLNNFCKVNEGVLGLWSRVLKAVDRSRLILLAPEGSHRRYVLDIFEREGITADRIELVQPRPRSRYLQLYQRIDIGLDTFPYNGHTTSLDSFWMGVPVVTLVGQTVVGRAGLCQLTNLSLPELITSTPEEYLQIVTALANDFSRLRVLRHTLRERITSSPLMDAPRFARNIETAYREMWRKWCATV